jgi:hypothetical protein
MELVLFYFGLAIVVGVAANTRGRSGGGWFLLSLLITPVITGLLVLALPRVGPSAAPPQPDSSFEPPPQPDRSFEPDAVLKGFPYRRREDGTVDVMMTGGLVHFRDMEQFRAVVEERDEDHMNAGFTAQQSTPTGPFTQQTPMAGFGKRRCS